MKSIVIADSEWGIGKDGGLLVQTPGDMRFFRNQTMGGIVIMGRKTLDSFVGGRPLSGRENWVLTKNPELLRHTKEQKENGVNTGENLPIFFPDAASVLTEARKAEAEGKRVFVIGGGAVYDLFLPYCEEALVTRLNRSFDADTFFPNLDGDKNWELVYSGEPNFENSVTYRFTTYRRIKKEQAKPASQKPGKLYQMLNDSDRF